MNKIGERMTAEFLFGIVEETKKSWVDIFVITLVVKYTEEVVGDIEERLIVSH
jgi:hypothetical protein